jgi:small subunit ribosomal protein S18
MVQRTQQRRRPPGGRRYFPRRKVCAFCVDKVTHIDYKDPSRLRRYISDWAKIEPRRKTGTCAPHQRALTLAIKRARFMSLLPFTGSHSLMDLSRPDRPGSDRFRSGGRDRNAVRTAPAGAPGAATPAAPEAAEPKTAQEEPPAEVTPTIGAEAPETIESEATAQEEPPAEAAPAAKTEEPETVAQEEPPAEAAPAAETEEPETVAQKEALSVDDGASVEAIPEAEEEPSSPA